MQKRTLSQEAAPLLWAIATGKRPMDSRIRLEERHRLARDLHDTVTQSLHAINVIADLLPRLWAANPTSAQAQVDELHVLARGTLAEMRGLLCELRPDPSIDLPVALRQLADALRAQAY